MATINGTTSADTLQGTDAADEIFLSDGNDRGFGRGGADDISGGAGNDTLYGMAGNDTLVGNAGNDLLFGGAGNDSLAGTTGNDTFAIEANSAFGNDTFSGGFDHDVAIIRSAAIIEVNGSISQVFELAPTTGVSINLINAFNPGVVQTFNPVIDEDGLLSAGLGQVRGTVTLESIEEIRLTDFADHIVDDGTDREILGLGGDDFIEGGAGFDVLDGGEGRDTVMYTTSNAGVSVALLDFGSGQSATGGHATGDLLFGFENVIGSRFADTLTGANDANHLAGFDGDDALFGLLGDDSLFGGAGNDLLVGGAGADVLDGGEGSDTVSFNLSSAGVTVRLETGSGSGGDAEGDTYRGIENVIGSRGNDLISGDGNANILSGHDGADVIEGGRGADTLRGDAGNDVLRGGFGFDSLEGGSGDDTLDGGIGDDILAGGAGIDTVSFASLRPNAAFGENTAQSGFTIFLDFNPFGGTGGVAMTASRLDDGRVDPARAVEIDLLSGFENVEGSGFSDVIFGGAGANRIVAGGGNDNINGGAGADTIDGGAGFDFASYYTAASGVTVSLADPARGTGDAAGDVFSGIEGLVGSAHADALDGDAQNNVLIGGDGGDTLAGGGGADILIGGEGSDVLIGGAGIDRLEGGAGADFFTFLSPADGPDVVADFAAGDFVLVDDAAFAGLAPGFLDAGSFVTGFAPTQAGAQFVYATANGDGFLFFDADGTGAAAGLVHVATFAGAPALGAQDIFVF